MIARWSPSRLYVASLLLAGCASGDPAPNATDDPVPDVSLLRREATEEQRVTDPQERLLAGGRSLPPPLAEAFTPCGPRWCSSEQVCCNASCGICTAPGEPCIAQVCGIVPPWVERCGESLCAPGSYCCNESCGICAPLGASCVQVECDARR